MEKRILKFVYFCVFFCCISYTTNSAFILIVYHSSIVYFSSSPPSPPILVSVGCMPPTAPPDKDSSASQRLKGFSTDSLFEDQNIDSPYQLKTVLTEESTAVSLGALSELDRFPGLGFSPKAFTEQKSPTALCPSTKGSPKSDIALLSNLNQKNLRMDTIMTGARGDIVLPLTPTKTLKYWQGSSLPSGKWLQSCFLLA